MKNTGPTNGYSSSCSIALMVLSGDRKRLLSNFYRIYKSIFLIFSQKCLGENHSKMCLSSDFIRLYIKLDAPSNLLMAKKNDQEDSALSKNIFKAVRSFCFTWKILPFKHPFHEHMDNKSWKNVCAAIHLSLGTRSSKFRALLTFF